MLILTLGRKIQSRKKSGIYFLILFVEFVLCILPQLVLYLLATTVSLKTEEKKDGKSLSVFNVVRKVVIKKRPL